VKQYKVSLNHSGREFLVREDESVLQGALRQGVMLPYSCKNGTCASCKGRLLEGHIHYPFHPPLALDRKELDQHQALFCQAAALSDLRIEVREIEAIRDIPVRTMPARVMAKELLSKDVMRLTLRLPKTMRMQFLAGQYIDILLPGNKRRAFSIASPPHEEDQIELHIRHVEGGDFTGFVFYELKEKSILRLEGPLGTFFVRNDQPRRPMIMMGGGTGFAPLKSMIEYLLRKKNTRPIDLYWGVRDEQELYMKELPEQWAVDHQHIRYIPALTDPAEPETWRGRTGLIHQVVLADHQDLASHDVYMSGPPMMIEAARHEFLANDLPESRLFYDSFEFGADVPVDVLAEPH